MLRSIIQRKVFIILLTIGIPAIGFVQTTFAQQTGFLDHLRIGFGVGANSSQIIQLQSYSVYEDLSGATYKNNYSGMLQNIGNQYFVQAEWYNDYIVVALKPGTSTYRFSKLNDVIFGSETVAQETPYLLRYISVPLEARYNVDLQRFRPYAGATVAYSYLLSAQDASNHTFIRSKFTAGIVMGTYIDLRYIILDLNAGYLSGLHNITNKSNRFATGNGGSFAQDDILLNNLQVSLSLLFSLQKQRRYSNTECYY